jgi:hypothetical protein
MVLVYLLVCPQAIREAFPHDPIPFGPGVALAGLSATGPTSHWHINWKCGSPLEFGKYSLSGPPNKNMPLLE